MLSQTSVIVLDLFIWFLILLSCSAESLVSFILCVQVRYILDNCKEDMDFFNTWIEKGIINRLNVVFC